MHVIIVSDDVIVPTNSGGRLEVLGECIGMAGAGCDISLVISHRQVLEDGAYDAHKQIASQVIFLRRQSFLRSSLTNPFLPYQISSRGALSVSSIDSLARETTLGVMASHEWTIPLARQIAERLKVPLILRSHNDELAYMKALANNATGMRRLYFRLEELRLRAAKGLYKSVNAVAVLAEDDLTQYASLRVPTRYIPPVLSVAPRYDDRSSIPAPGTRNLLFVGALDMPHTVAGLRWFCDDVLPTVQCQVPGAELHVAGRRAASHLTQLLRSTPGVVFHGEVEDLEQLYNQARVFINPVFEGSGVNMKVGAPAERGIPIVTTPVGARGLGQLLPGLAIAADAHEFAGACIELMVDDRSWANKSKNAQEMIYGFSAHTVGTQLVELLRRSATESI